MATVGFGGCTLQTCNIDQSIFKYRTSLAASVVFIALFGISLIIHAAQSIRSRQWVFGSLMMAGCLCEMVGYGGRIILHEDPWSFVGFIIQIVCITIAPVFMTAAIYVTLYKSIIALSPNSAPLKPAFYYAFFIPCDVISLVLQSVGGALSTQTQGSSRVAINIGLAGLSFQVGTLLFFIALSAQYFYLYADNVKYGRLSSEVFDKNWQIFVTFTTFATTVVFIRCVYRIYELSAGYNGTALHNQGAFIGLESCMVTLAVFALNAGHPGQAFKPRQQTLARRLLERTTTVQQPIGDKYLL